MRYLERRLHWIFLAPPHGFLWGIATTTLAAALVYWLCPGIRWYAILAASIQLAGVLITVIQLIQLRQELGAKPLAEIVVFH